MLLADLEEREEIQCCKNGGCQRTGLFYLGHDDGALRTKNHDVLPTSRLLCTADAAVTLTPPSPCDGG